MIMMMMMLMLLLMMIIMLLMMMMKAMTTMTKAAGITMHLVCASPDRMSLIWQQQRLNNMRENRYARGT